MLKQIKLGLLQWPQLNFSTSATSYINSSQTTWFIPDFLFCGAEHNLRDLWWKIPYFIDQCCFALWSVLHISCGWQNKWCKHMKHYLCTPDVNQHYLFGLMECQCILMYIYKVLVFIIIYSRSRYYIHNAHSRY